MDVKNMCDICEERHDSNNMHQIKIKGKTKNICKECAAAIKGFA